MAKKNETKLSAAFAKQLKGMGFNCKSEEDARKQLLAALEKEGIDGMEDESLQTLIDMVSGWRDTEDSEEEVDETEEDEEEVDEDEQDAEDLADEVEEEDAEEEEAETDEDDADEIEEDEEEVDDAEEEEPEEEQKPAKKATKKSTAKKSEEPKKKAATTKKAAEKKHSKRNSKKLDPKNNDDDRQALIDAFSKMFPTDTYLYAFVVNGVSIKYIGKNSKRGVFLYDNVTRHEDGTISGNLYLNTMTKETDKLDELGIDYQLCWTNAPFVKAVTIEEANDLLEKVFEIITSFVNKVDKRLGDNRKKMEESLEKAGKKSEKTVEKKKATKQVPKSKVDDEEEDDEVEEQEVKKSSKKTAVKKSVTKKTKK